MNNERAVIVLIENELYKYIKEIRNMPNVKEVEKAISEFTEQFKESVLKVYPVKNIDELIETTIQKMDEYEERNSDL